MKIGIIGGTGTLGQCLTKKLLARGDTVSVFSRCELKQSEMAKAFADSKLSFTVGDIRDRDAVKRYIRNGGFALVYHVAALKHVDVMEKNPEECFATNIVGTINVADACEESNVVSVAFSSTDKAVDPINVYGMCKGVAERILFNRNKNGSPTRYSVFRWGNVIGSRGSAIPYFVQAMRDGEVLTVTDCEMTRYWIRIEDAVDFMIAKQAYWNPKESEVPPMKSATILEVLSAIGAVLGLEYKFRTVGNRGGEKMHESIRSSFGPGPEDSFSSPRYTREELMDLVRPLCGAGA